MLKKPFFFFFAQDSLRFKGLKALTLSSQNKKKLLESAPVILESGTATVSRSAVKKSGSMGDLREDEVKQEAGRAQSEDEGGDEDAFDDMPSLSHVPVMSDEKRKELLARANLAGSGSAAAAKESALIASRIVLTLATTNSHLPGQVSRVPWGLAEDQCCPSLVGGRVATSTRAICSRICNAARPAFKI